MLVRIIVVGVGLVDPAPLADPSHTPQELGRITRKIATITIICERPRLVIVDRRQSVSIFVNKGNATNAVLGVAGAARR